MIENHTFYTGTESSQGTICSECNWTNCGLINLGEPGKPRMVCQGCCKRAFETLDKIKGWLFQKEIKMSKYDHSYIIGMCVIVLLITVFLLISEHLSRKHQILGQAFENGYEQVYDKEARQVIWKKVKELE